MGTAPDRSTFHPVTENVFPTLPTVTVRSHMPGSEAMDVCGAGESE